MEKDKGYEFLFGDDKKSGSFQCADGSDCYIYSDGSGYYHGADGSDGYIYSDGSGYFRGADGSEGHKYSDGSGYFRGGSSGVDAYQYSDGSGYYEDATHGRQTYWPIEKKYSITDSDSSSHSSGEGSSSLAELGGVLLGIGLLALLGRKNKQEEPDTYSWIQQEENQKQLELKREKQKERRKKCYAFLRGHWKGVLFSILCVILSVVIALAIGQYRKLIPVTQDSDTLLRMDYEQVVILLHEAGFTNIQAECTRDLDFENLNKENQVYQVYIGGENSFDPTDKYPYDTEIIIKYHGAKLIPLPRSAKDMKGANYIDIVNELESAGFANIQLVVKYDIITGWFIDDGEVESVIINSEKRFTKDDLFRPDANIVITYHTLKKNKDAE